MLLDNTNDNQNTVYDPLNQLRDKGTKLSNFEEIEKNGKSYWISGKGSYGYIENMKSKINNKIYTIKKYKRDSINKTEFLRETEIMLNLNHENIIKLYGYFKDNENKNKYNEIFYDRKQNDIGIFCLVMEFTPNSSLEEYYSAHSERYLDKKNFVPISQNFILKILKQLLSALKYLGSKSIMHRDFQPHNLLLDENNNIKISGFDISALLNDGNPENKNKDTTLFSSFTAVGRQDFIAPEIEKKEQYDFRIDIYSLGLTMLCLMSKEYPIKLIKNITNVLKFDRNVNIGKMDKIYNIYLRALILRMLSNNMEGRPYANQAYEELEKIEQFINNPNDYQIKDYLDEKYGKLIKLENIGIKLSDFEEIPKKDCKYSLLGLGYFGYAEKMKSKIDNKVYFIKKYIKDSPYFNSKDFFRETEIMINLDNENIVKFYGFFEDTENFNKINEIYKDIKSKSKDKEIYCLVFEDIQNGSLEEYYKKHMDNCNNNYSPIDQKFILKIFKQTLNGLKYLAGKSILHRNIKPNHLLLDESNNVKISGFNMSALYYDNNPENKNKESALFTNYTAVGRKDFVAPEVEIGKKYDFKIDMFSLGLTMLCLMSKKYPIEIRRNTERNQTIRKINKDDMDDNYNIYLKKLVLRMLNDKEYLRPFANQAYDEINYIEKLINNPKDKEAKEYLEIANQNKRVKINLENIGNKLSDFEEIPKEDCKYSLLGHGNFGYVEKMKSKINNKIYAIKKLVKDNKNFKLKDFFRETENMINLEHENIVKFYGFFEGVENINKYKEIWKDKEGIENETKDKEIYCLVLEYISNGSLENYYKKHMQNCNNSYVPIDQNFILKIFKQTLNGLNYLSSKKIMHRDIKLDNILLDENNNVKISDFGISALHNDNNQDDSENQENNDSALLSSGTTVGRNDFVAPEVYQEGYDYKIDIFSLGLTMLCLMSKKYPIELSRHIQTKELERIINKKDIDESYNIYLKKLVLRMLKDKEDRPFANQAYYEINFIEQLINNPNNQRAKEYLENANDPNNKNKNINNNNQNYIDNQNYNNNQYYINNNNNNNNSTQQNNKNEKPQYINPFAKIASKNAYISQFKSIDIKKSQNSFVNNNENTQMSKMSTSIDSLVKTNTYNTQQYIKSESAKMVNPFASKFKSFDLKNNQNSYVNNNENYTQMSKMSESVDSSIKSNTEGITSILQILQCLYSVIENSLFFIKFYVENISYSKKNISFSLDLFNIFETIDKGFPYQNNDLSFLNKIKEFRNKADLNIFRGNDEIEPNWLIYELFNKINSEFLYINNNKENGILYQNKIFKGLIDPPDLPRSSFQEIYKNCQNFEKEYSNPFVDIFYFILLDLTKCNRCGKILDCKSKISYFIGLDGKEEGVQISNLIGNFMKNPSSNNYNQNYYCNVCNDNMNVKNEYSFLNTPKYLIVEFEGEKCPKILENDLDLTSYSMSNIGPKNYTLYAYIARVKNGDFYSFIKFRNVWYIFTKDNNAQRVVYLEGLNFCYSPYLAIYQGVN